jgi:hypothetical protein
MVCAVVLALPHAPREVAGDDEQPGAERPRVPGVRSVLERCRPGRLGEVVGEVRVTDEVPGHRGDPARLGEQELDVNAVGRGHTIE